MITADWILLVATALAVTAAVLFLLARKNPDSTTDPNMMLIAAIVLTGISAASGSASFKYHGKVRSFGAKSPEYMAAYNGLCAGGVEEFPDSEGITQKVVFLEFKDSNTKLVYQAALNDDAQGDTSFLAAKPSEANTLVIPYSGTASSRTTAYDDGKQCSPEIMNIYVIDLPNATCFVKKATGTCEDFKKKGVNTIGSVPNYAIINWVRERIIK